MPLVKKRLKKRRLKKWGLKKSKISLIIDNAIERFGKNKDIEKVEIRTRFKIHFKSNKKPATRYAKEIVKYD
jgi:hypothetical protein